jgi:hypothetical protein
MVAGISISQEEKRLQEAGPAWRTWGPYLSARAWGTVREDYSADGSAWDFFPHDHARSRAYRWNEDGLGGICDSDQRLCFALALWNGNDPILKERIFGLTGREGNHGEDVKEYYYYLDSTPTHSYMKMLYKYPQSEYPYSDLVEENGRRSKSDPEYELIDTGVFDEDKYFDVFIEYAKAGPEDILIRITAVNRGPDPAKLTMLPTFWFRNDWSWGGGEERPYLHFASQSEIPTVCAEHPRMDRYILLCEGAQDLLFTQNETNTERLYNIPNAEPYVKDAFDNYLVHGKTDAVNPNRRGTKAAALYVKEVAPGEAWSVRLRLRNDDLPPDASSHFENFDTVFETRQVEADAFYATVQSPDLSEDRRNIQRQAFAGMLWSKQFYHFDIERWIAGDPNGPPPPPQRKQGRNNTWKHVSAHDVMSMPDEWEYPWFAAWDLAFHCVTLALIDPNFAKEQITLVLREWYMNPSGQVPAYEWAFNDVNPPVLAWAAWRIYHMEEEQRGTGDDDFLKRVFHKLMLNFTWWVNRKDSDGSNVFEGGFLGLDNIGVFDRSSPLPGGVVLEQSDATCWMAMFCLDMTRISLALSRSDPSYEDVATKFVQHFLYIVAAMNNMHGEGISLWDDEDQFFYDVLRAPDGRTIKLKVHSLVGLFPLFAVAVIDPDFADEFPGFMGRMEWFLNNKPGYAEFVSEFYAAGQGERRILTLTYADRLRALLRRALDPAEFLSDYGIRSLSKYHEEHPYVLQLADHVWTIAYDPAESHSGMFGGNSNWRGPVWFPINYMFIQSLRIAYRYYRDRVEMECPTGSGQMKTVIEVANDLSNRLISLFERDANGRRPFNGNVEKFQTDPHWRDYILFYEYFHGDTGAGLGASHQTGWTGLVANLIQEQGTR